LIAGSPQTAQQPCFSASLQGCVDGQAAVRFKIPTESSTGQKQRHGWTFVGRSLAGAVPLAEGSPRSCMFFVCSIVLCPSASRASSRWDGFGDCAGSPGQCGSPGRRRETERSSLTSVIQVPALLNRSLAPSKHCSEHFRTAVSSTTASTRSARQTLFGSPDSGRPAGAYYLPCPSASLGRSWECPSSSTSRAKPSRSP
jgi:hypothetical protein